MNRKREQADLLFKLGQFLGPPLKVAENPANYDHDERTRIMARVYSEATPFMQQVNQFVRGEKGHYYSAQHELIHAAVNMLSPPTFKGGDDNRILLEVVNQVIKIVQDAILCVPVPVDSTIYEARTPFTTYCFVKDLCSTVRDKAVWLDRYFDQTVFHRFFTETPRTAQVTLVTLPGANLTQKKDKERHAEFMDISKTFAAERGPQGYRLIANGTFHDRWLRCDDRLFVLGGSIKDLAKPFTISRLDSTPDNLKHFDDVVAGGTEVFGPNQPIHP